MWNDEVEDCDTPLRDQLAAHLSAENDRLEPSALRAVQDAVAAETEEEAAHVMVGALADAMCDAERWGIDKGVSQTFQDLYSALDGDDPTREQILDGAYDLVVERDLSATLAVEQWPVD